MAGPCAPWATAWKYTWQDAKGHLGNPHDPKNQEFTVVVRVGAGMAGSCRAFSTLPTPTGFTTACTCCANPGQPTGRYCQTLADWGGWQTTLRMDGFEQLDVAYACVQEIIPPSPSP